MGFFSWLTADTKVSIPCAASGRTSPTVYLLQPNGRAPIPEDCYEGDGIFGGQDAHLWLASQNIPLSVFAGLSEPQQLSAGISLAVGNYFVDAVTEKRYTFFNGEAATLIPGYEDVEHIQLRFDQPLSQFGGQTANDLIGNKRLIIKSFEPQFPLKFSFDPKARYEDLPASEICPDQGFFYD